MGTYMFRTSLRSHTFVVMLLGFCSMHAMDKPGRQVVNDREEALRRLNATPVNMSGIVDTTGYSREGIKLTITAPYQLINPDTIFDGDETDVLECIVKLHSYSSEISVVPLFDKMTNLTTLRLQNMSVKNIVYALKKPCYTLDELEISGTDITKISLSELVSNFPCLTKLLLPRNKISTISPIEQQFTKVCTIDLSHNQLQNIDLNILLNSASCLKKVDVSDNPIERVVCDVQDMLEHDSPPQIVMKNSLLKQDQKSALEKLSCADSSAYIWAKKIVPGMLAIGTLSSIYRGAQGDWKLIAMASSVGVPGGIVIGRLMVDHLLFPENEDRYICYFKPEFS